MSNFTNVSEENAFERRIQRYDYIPDGDYNDLLKVLIDFGPVFAEKMTDLLSVFNSLKSLLIITAQYCNDTRPDAIPFSLFFRSSYY